MKPSLQPGLTHELRFVVPEAKTVPALYPESAQFRAMPSVLATGYLVGLLEWACIETIAPHLDGPGEQSLGTHIDASHLAATPPGLELTVRARLTAVDGRRLQFEVEAHDGVDLVSRARHERVVIDRARFVAKVAGKAARAATAQAPGEPADAAAGTAAAPAADASDRTAAERRRYHRIGFDAPARWERGSRHVPVTVVDLSFKGALVAWTGPTPALGERGVLRVSLGQDGEQIRMDTEVRHVDGSLLGLACSDLDLDSMTHLRQLVSLNLGDPALVERDLKALVAG
jgi:fluoroacetyl-CoA thioesterase